MSLVKFSADACTEDRIKRAHKNYPGKIGFKCAVDPTGSKSCSVVGAEDDSIYPGTLPGCIKCTSECIDDSVDTSESRGNPTDDHEPEPEESESESESKFGMLPFIAVAVILIIIIIILYLRMRETRNISLGW